MITFSQIWKNEAKPLAQACLGDTKLIELLKKGEDYLPNETEKEYLKNVSEEYKDIYGMYYIYDMILKVEHALADNKKEVALFAITHVYTVLNSPSYFKNVFNHDENNEEWKTRKSLRDGLSKLLYV